MILLLLSIFNMLMAPVTRYICLPETQPTNIYERLMSAIVAVESQGDNYAFNLAEQAAGPFQIRPIRLEHYNRRTGSHYIPGDTFDYEISRKIFLYYTKGRSYEKVARSWNGSGPMTKEYWKKIKKEL